MKAPRHTLRAVSPRVLLGALLVVLALCVAALAAPVAIGQPAPHRDHVPHRDPVAPWGNAPLDILPAFVAPEGDFSDEAAARQEAAAWAMVPRILERIRPPRFPDRTCDIRDHGAAPDSLADARPAILAAIAACAEAGGGRVVVPPGQWLSNGPVHLRSNIDLHLAEGARLRFGTDPAMYEPLVLVRWEGVFAYNYSPLVYARGVENVAITGRGTLDGQAEGTWSLWKRDNDGRNQETAPNKPLLRRMGAERVPIAQRVFGGGVADTNGDGRNDGDGQPRYLRPGLVHFLEARNVLVEDVTLVGSPFWTLHTVLSENVTVRRTTIRPGTTNDDGIDPESSRFVLIEDNDILTDDDAIAIKAGRDQDGRAYPGTAYVVIRRNRLRSTVGGAMSIGSEMSGGVEWVFIEDNVAENARGRGLYLKSNLDRGGYMRHVYVRGLDVLTAVQGFEITSDYHSWRGEVSPTDVHDVFVRGVRVWEATRFPLRLLGQEGAHVRRIALRDVQFRGAAAPELRWTRDVLADGVRINGAPWHMPAPFVAGPPTPPAP